jgi:hypothetical protein
MTKQVLLYEKAVPVSSARHRDWSVKSGNDFGFARDINSVPLIALEFPRAAEEYPIVFAGKDDALAPLAILGVRSGQNLYVSETGQWKARYVPAFVRRYPFVFAASPDGTNLTLCIDEGFPGCNMEGRGERLFDAEGERTQYLNATLEFLRDYEVQFQRTRAFCRRLMDLNLLEPVHAQFTSPGGGTGALGGFMAVNRDRLRSIPDDKLVEMMKAGELELTYLHLFSLRNFRSMLELSAARAPEPARPAEAREGPASEGSGAEKGDEMPPITH